MPGSSGIPGSSGGGALQKRAEQLRAEAEAKRRAATGSATPATAARAAPGGPPAQPESKPADEVTSPGPVGSGDYLVVPGDCISAIARESGHFWETIWNDPDNAELKQARKDPNVLLRGDRLTIPDKERKDESIAPEMRHRFIRRGEPSKLVMRFEQNGAPRGNTPFELHVDGQTFFGTTDAEGKLQVNIPGNARRATLRLGEGVNLQEYQLQLGRIEPISELCGVQTRLNNLDYGCGPSNNKMSPALAQALSRFQRDHGLPETGLPDESTRATLVKIHGC